MSKPKIYVTRLIAQEGLTELQQVCEMHMWKKIVVPHIGSGTYQTRIRMSDMAAHNIVRTLCGKPMLSCVNPAAIGKGRSASLFR